MRILLALILIGIFIAIASAVIGVFGWVIGIIILLLLFR